MENLPADAFDGLLQFLYAEDIVRLSYACKSINQSIKNSYYQVLKNKIKNWSIYSNNIMCAQARDFLSFHYVYTNAWFGKRPDYIGFMVGDYFEVNDEAEMYQKYSDKYLPIKANGNYLNREIVLRCTWLSLKITNLQHLKLLY